MIQKKDFDKWYLSIKDKEFSFYKEIRDYCNSDVDLLMNGCLSFRKIIMKITKTNENKEPIDPFQKSITIASLCHYIFRNRLMKSDSIAIIPENGYNPEQKTSNKAQLWLKYLSFSQKIFIEHSKNKGEIRLENYFGDGYHRESNTIFEFHGCFWHGCPLCFSSNTFNKIKQQTMGFIYLKHLERISIIKKLILNSKEIKLIEIWEHEWDQMTKNNKDINHFITFTEIKSPLSPRDAFFGGRTNAFKLYYKTEINEKIKYFDFTSLYPYVQKYCEFPVGHPEILTENFANQTEYFGFIKCKILPPQNLLIPVLPAKINGKLLFTLCSKCAINKITKCLHSDDERCLEGTWVTLEINEALKQGYKIKTIFEVWNFKKTSKLDKTKNSGGLFTDYINMFLKGKQEASGYPTNIQSFTEKEFYINDYLKNEGIKLDPEKIKLNSGMRSVMKLLLNSFWGRFGMNSNKVQYKVIKEPHEWFLFISDDQKIIHNVDFTHKEYLQVYFSYEKELYEGNTQVNVSLAAFVTCHARLKLLTEMQKLENRLLYADTDSIIFISRENQYEPELGDFLGEFTNEIEDELHIVEFVSAGPKNYAYKLSNDKTHALCKGISLNYKNSLKINFDSIKEIVTENHSQKIIAENLKFSRNKVDWTVSTNLVSKLYGFVYDKRILLPNLDTVPYGFC